MPAWRGDDAAMNITDHNPDPKRGARRFVRLLTVAAIVVPVAAAITVVARRRAAAGRTTAEQAFAAISANESASGGSVTNGVGDDLKIVEGIGPRIETVLKGAGVTTYGELAELTPRRIERIMKEAGTRMAKPDTWPEQARLAADGRWEALQELQAQLKGGVLR